MKEWKTGEKYNMINQMNKLTFSITTLVLFGGDMTSISTKLLYYPLIHILFWNIFFVKFLFNPYGYKNWLFLLLKQDYNNLVV